MRIAMGVMAIGSMVVMMERAMTNSFHSEINKNIRNLDDRVRILMDRKYRYEENTYMRRAYELQVEACKLEIKKQVASRSDPWYGRFKSPPSPDYYFIEHYGLKDNVKRSQ